MRAALAVVILLSGNVAVAEEGDKDLARQRYKTGQALFQRGRVADALREFEEGKLSFALPEFDYNIGLCLAKLDRPREAADALQRYMDARPDDPDAAGIWKMIAELRAEAVRREATRAVEPSPQPTLALAPPPPPPVENPRARRRWLQTRLGIAAAVVGGVAVLAGVFTGFIALGEKDDYDKSCARFNCNDETYDRAHGLANATDFLIPVGAALVVTSIVLLVTRPKLPPKVAWGVQF